jgi:hypothetical protein
VSEGEQAKPSLWQVIKSVLAAFLGVQSNENRERDFTHGSAAMFIAVGLGMTLLFILAVWTVVKLVLPETP